jgi:hypothetical protein
MGSRNAGGVSPRRFHCILLLLIGFLTNRVVLGDASVGFELLKADLTGLVFTNSVPPSRYLTNQIPLNGSGVFGRECIVPQSGADEVRLYDRGSLWKNRPVIARWNRCRPGGY